MILKVMIIRDAPDIRPDNPAYFEIRYPAGYRIFLAGYPAKLKR
jgi:hypothetical protein